MPDLERTAARLLRLALWGGAVLVLAGGLLDASGVAASARIVSGIGVGVVIGAPFVTLVAIAVVGRRTRTALYALASLVMAAAGLLLAG